MLYYTDYLQIKSLVADALCITVCARERYMVVTGRALKATKASGKEHTATCYSSIYVQSWR